MTTKTNALIALLCALQLGMMGCGRNEKGEQTGETGTGVEKVHVLVLSAASVQEIGLAWSVAEIDTLRVTMTVPAKLLPNQDLEAQVASLVQGRVREVFVNVGDVVRVGQELMRIEGLEVGEIKSNFIKAKAELQFAQANYLRQKTLLEEKVGSQKAFLEVQSAYEKALAEFNAEDKRIHSIGLSDEDLLQFVEHPSQDKNSHTGGVLPIKSPLAGTIVARNVVIGQHVDASTTAFRIVNTSTLWADGQVYENDVPRLSGKPEVRLTVTAYPHEEFRGKVIYVSPIVDERTRTIAVRASIPNVKGRLKPQMFGELHIPVGGAAIGLFLPAEAVLTDVYAKYVFVATSDTTFERREVHTGISVDSLVELRSGIRRGERIVVKGTFLLKSELMKETLEGGE